MTDKNILRMEHISKNFPGVKVLADVSLDLREGEVLALIGENGAGKSTLMNILMGLFPPTGGEIFINGEKVQFANPAEALRNGVAMIYQELNPILDMTVADNIFLNREDTVRGTPFVDRKKLYQDAQALLDQYQMTLSPKAKMRSLSVAECQMIEIIKAVSYDSKIIIMDEPSSSLSEKEAEKMFDTIRDLKARGIGIIYISHRMEEIFNLADRVAVLRDGQMIEICGIGDHSQNELVNLMVGRELSEMFPKTFCDIGETALKIENFSSGKLFRDISFEVRKGEILGLSGLVGAGRSEVIKAVFGLDPKESGRVWLEGKELNIKSPADAIAHGIAMVSEDRKKYGLVLCRSIKENTSLAHLKMFAKGLRLINGKKEAEVCKHISKRMNLKCSGLSQKCINLSGGNQQKVVLAKCLIDPPKVLILDEPTRGIDVGAKAEIHRMMCELAAAGMAIILISSELPEILGMSDRILVMGDGKIKGEFSREEASQGTILAAALS